MTTLQHGATLNGIVNPNGLDTTYSFEYGIDKTYGNVIDASDVLTGDVNAPVATDVINLLAETNYHFRLVAENEAGIVKGLDKVFTTLYGKGSPVHPTKNVDKYGNPVHPTQNVDEYGSQVHSTKKVDENNNPLSTTTIPEIKSLEPRDNSGNETNPDALKPALEPGELHPAFESDNLYPNLRPTIPTSKTDRLIPVYIETGELKPDIFNTGTLKENILNTGDLNADLTVDNNPVAPKNADEYGNPVPAKSAGEYSKPVSAKNVDKYGNPVSTKNVDEYGNVSAKPYNKYANYGEAALPTVTTLDATNIT